MSVAPNGQIIHSAPALHKDPIQSLPGGSALEAAASKTVAAQQQQAAAAKSLGAGQHGSGRRRKYKGGSQNAVIPELPQGGTLKGITHEQNHLDAVNTLNQLRADKVGDADINAQPIKIGGTKRRRRTNGRRRNRSHRRNNRRSTRRSRRIRRRV